MWYIFIVEKYGSTLRKKLEAMIDNNKKPIYNKNTKFYIFKRQLFKTKE